MKIEKSKGLQICNKVKKPEFDMCKMIFLNI